VATPNANTTPSPRCYVRCSAALGTHNGLPVTVIATATVQDLQAQTGHAVTAGGTYLPIKDLILMAAHSYQYLALFDGVTGRALWLGRTKRIASADQRIVLHARDRGCSYPDCDMPGYLTEVHHVQDWAQGGPTDIDNLTFALRTASQTARQGLANEEEAARQPNPVDPTTTARTTQRNQ